MSKPVKSVSRELKPKNNPKFSDANINQDNIGTYIYNLSLPPLIAFSH